jgi:hypothetical protein
MPNAPRDIDQATAASALRQPLPGVARLNTDPERLEQMWQLTAAQRVRAAARGNFTLGEMLRWAARAPHEVPLVNGEFFFIAHFETDDN